MPHHLVWRVSARREGSRVDEKRYKVRSDEEEEEGGREKIAGIREEKQ